ncbi:MAG: DegT/DnrJ/EryC1/StrS family aminotransferase, partial [bacterium]
YGDASTISFHATKIFHTIEGGGIVFEEDKMIEKAYKAINFGFENYYKITELGINGKMNEFEAAMGLANLEFIEEVILKRKKVAEIYLENLKNLEGEGLIFQKWNENANKNYSYFPIVFQNQSHLEKVIDKLASKNIYPRRYFYPSLDKLPYLKSKQKLENSDFISNRILCLPI